MLGPGGSSTKPSVPARDVIVGAWKVRGGGSVMVFNRDGTVSDSYPEGASFSGQYKFIDNNTLDITIGGTTYRWKVISCSRDEITFQTPDKKITLVRDEGPPPKGAPPGKDGPTKDGGPKDKKA